MPQHDDNIAQMRQVAGSLPPTARLREVLDELLHMVDHWELTYNPSGGAANAVALYRNQALFGALVNYKPNNVPSFVHELTHARCIQAYRAETMNYLPIVPSALVNQYSQAPPTPSCPKDTRFLLNSALVMQSYKVDHCKAFLDLNLNRLLQWAQVTDFSAPLTYMSAQEKAALKLAEKRVGKSLAHANNFSRLQAEAELRGVVQKSRKFRKADDINATRVDTEKQRKRDYVIERINYGLNGMSGMGDTHNEYDTVVNQMLYQMHQWGFRGQGIERLTLVELDDHAQHQTVPAGYLYDLIATLAKDARDRRVNAQAIANHSNPLIAAPAAIINPPPVR